MLHGYQPSACERLVVSFVKVKSQRCIQTKRVAGSKEVSRAPLYTDGGLTRRKTLADGWFLLALQFTMMVSLRVGYSTSVHGWRVCVGRVHKVSVVTVSRFI